jgi:hypothetical protein
MDLAEELFDAILAGDRLVVDEPELGHAFQAEAGSDLAPEKRAGSFERTRRALAGVRIAKRGVVHARLLNIGADLNARHGHEPDTGIVKLASRQQRRDLAADLIGHAVGTGSLGHASGQKFDVSAGDEAWLDPLDFVCRGGELAIRMRLIGTHGDDRQRGPLPEILMLDFGHGDVKFLQPVLHAPQDDPLVLQGSGTWHMKFDRQQTNHHLNPAATEDAHDSEHTARLAAPIVTSVLASATL